MEKVRRWGTNIFGGEEEEEARCLHGAGRGIHSEEWLSSRGGRR
jgi:hypothetical protein